MTTPRVDLSKFRNRLGWRNKLGRALWGVVWLLLFRPSPRPMFAWRRWLLRRFGAQVSRTAMIYAGVRVWAPWNLEVLGTSWVADGVDCYCVDRVRIGPDAVVSQRAFLCTASHDVSDPAFRLVTAPISIGAGAWVAAEAFIGPGVTLNEGSVAAARACVVRDVPSWTVVGGNPARSIKRRELNGG